MADEKPKAEGNVTEKPAEGQQIRITVDDKDINACYANFCRVMGTPEEVILDFALNPMPMSQQDQNVKVSQRLVMNYYTAKRLFATLQQTILRHEQNFGAIELNVQRRLSPAAAGNEKK